MVHLTAESDLCFTKNSKRFSWSHIKKLSLENGMFPEKRHVISSEKQV